ncbi:MAG: hypothetical protein A2V81_04175 [Candidatus Abawacabacteria bacterium RBG_16_42_10]|uniref:Polymerase nucleotidyl transferase domain-containing protein n=1 Tax=Candidatus Abawacabacteria bacterium RBG_16_42_10 TaxID=1817814 RepID=A0A1F4XK03_9BACT|nr:MAG: hypothetical protein A2V81_04175 [Candidatus Abawacabacteria bacterium RBG_16_42_10]
MELHRNKLIAAFTPIAFFRAINGSYDMENVRKLTYKTTLTDQEWQELVSLYNQKFQEERKRNDEQKKKHAQLKEKFQEKITQLKKIAASIPEITDIFLVNSYALGSLKETSDIDLLVITKPDTMWWTRLKLTAALELAGIRRKPGNIEEQFCLSFFITENAMDMSKIAIDDDLYLHFWISSVQSLLNRSLSSWHEQNPWLKDIFPSFSMQDFTSPPVPAQLIVPPTTPTSSPPSSSHFLNSLVRPLMQWRHRMKQKQLGPEASIVVSDTMFKFHNLDRRQHYKEQTLQELERLLAQANSKACPERQSKGSKLGIELQLRI